MKKLLSIISLLAVAISMSAQGAHDFRINEVFVLGCPKACPKAMSCDSASQTSGPTVARCQKPSFYVDEYGEPASWIEIENTSYTTHDLRNCFITTDRAVLDKSMSAPDREQLMSLIPAGDPRTLISGKQRLTFFAGHPIYTLFDSTIPFTTAPAPITEPVPICEHPGKIIEFAPIHTSLPIDKNV